ncbi:autotransporter outer membrane beta-barrel domain-containing protein [Shewanella sp. GXUN23E]
MKPFSISVSQIGSRNAELPGGNQLDRESTNLDVDAGFRLAPNWVAGVSLGADWLDYQADRALDYTHGWQDIQRYSAGMFVRYSPNEHWSFMLAPKLQYAWAQGANRSDAQSYGVVVSGSYRFESGNSLGIGAAYLNDVDEVRTVPYLAINWQLAERWRLANPFQAGFSGPAGLELRYTLSDEWQFGLGSSRRTQRFLMAAAGKQAAEIEEWVGFARATWTAHGSWTVDMAGGWYFDSQLQAGVVKQELGSQLAAALAVKFAF